MGYYYTIYRPKTGNTRAELEIRYFCISTSDSVRNYHIWLNFKTAAGGLIGPLSEVW